VLFFIGRKGGDKASLSRLPRRGSGAEPYEAAKPKDMALSPQQTPAGSPRNPPLPEPPTPKGALACKLAYWGREGIKREFRGIKLAAFI